MKKSILLLLLSVLLFSCSKTENVQVPNPTLLKKIIKNPNTSEEQHWNFDDNGYLKEIVRKDGTVLFSFQFDANGNLIAPICSNCKNYTYDAAKDEYTHPLNPVGTDLFNFVRLKLAKNGLLASSVFDPCNGCNLTDYSMLYKIAIDYSDVNNVVKKGYIYDDNYRMYDYDDKKNEISKSLIPIFKEMIWVNEFDPNSEASKFIINNYQYVSLNNPLQTFYADYIGDEITYYRYNEKGQPKLEFIEHIVEDDISGAHESIFTGIIAVYYYQGEIIP